MTDNITMGYQYEGRLSERPWQNVFGRIPLWSHIRQLYGAEITFASTFPGAIIAADIGSNLSFRKVRFMYTAFGGTKVYILIRALSQDFSEEGFILQKLSGNGLAFLKLTEHMKRSLAPRSIGS